MSWEYASLVGQLTELAKALDDEELVAADEVGTTDGTAK
jgi:hypothetical protein